MPMSGNGVPPVDDSRIARMPQVGASAHESGCAQPGRSEIGTRKPQISQIGYSTHRAERPGGAVAREGHGHQEPERADREDRRRDCRGHEQRMLERNVDPEHEPAPEERRDHAVDPDRRGREREGQEHEREVGRRRNEQLERPEPALAVERRPGRHARRRPDAHHRSAKRCVDEGLGIAAGPEHEERDGGEEERPAGSRGSRRRRIGSAASRSTARRPAAAAGFSS